MSKSGHLCALVLSLVTVLSASSLTVVTSNIPAGANKIAIIVDGGSINGSVSAYQDITLGAQTTSTYVFNGLPAGPFRARVLAFQTQTSKALRTGRAVSVPADGTASVLLGDLGEAVATTPDPMAFHGGQKIVTFRIPDPGGWLEGTEQEVSLFPRPLQEISIVATLQRLLPSGEWEASAAIPIPINGSTLQYWLTSRYLLPLPKAVPQSNVAIGSSWASLNLVNSASVSLTLTGLPPRTTGAFLLVDRSGISATRAAVFPVVPDAAGSAHVEFGLLPGGPYRVRAVAVTSEPSTYFATGILAASGQIQLVIPPGASASPSLRVQPMSIEFEAASVAIGRWVSPSFVATDPGSVVEGIYPYILNGPSASDIRTYVYPDDRFQKVGPSKFRASATMNPSVYFFGSSAIHYTVGVAPFAEGTSFGDLWFSTAPATVTINGGIPCAPNPLPYIALNASGGGTYLPVPVPNGCPWTVRSTVPWLRVFPTSGVGPTTVTWTAAPNFTRDFRSGYLLFGDVTLTISEQQPTEDSDTRFIRQLYFNFLGRYPSDAETAGQKATLAGGMSRAALANNFASSAEFQLAGRYIAGLYYGILGRDAELAGWLFQRDALIKGIATPTGLVDNFLNSQEFALRNGPLDNAAFVRLLYRQILLREASASEVTGQSQALATGQVTRSSLTAAFLRSPEFAMLAGPRLTAFVVYATLLERDGSAQELTDAAAEIQAGTSTLTLIDEVLNSREFRRY